MEQSKREKIIALHNEFKNSEAYLTRKNQVTFIPVFKDIITETLKKEKLQNQDLTDLIQILKWNCSNDNFDNKLQSLVGDPIVRKNISDKSYELEVRGFTNAGKTAVTGLNKQQLDEVKLFLLNAYKVKTIEEAYNLCHTFELKNIPEVKRGIYSPWLFYINPKIFPIVNNTHKEFKSYFNISDYYPESLKELNEYNEILGEPDLAIMDSIGHHFTKDGKLNYRRKFYLNGKGLYKLSHGTFYKTAHYRNSGIIEVLEENNWVTVNQYTGKGAGDTFENGLQIGDIVYVCYGGDKVHCVGEITSKAKPFSKKYGEMIGDEDGEWLYREIKVLFTPFNSNVKDLKDERSQIMPSGYSTLWQIKPHDLDYMNENLFIPKFNLEILEDEEELYEDFEEEINPNELTLNKYAMSLNTILFGPPGTGKTYTTVDMALDILGEDTTVNREKMKHTFAEYQKSGRIFFCSFHQNLGYEDFIEGIKPVEPEEEDDFLKYEIRDGLFMKACVEATYNLLAQSQVADNVEIQNYLDYNALFDKLYDYVLENDNLELSTKSDVRVIVSTTSQGNFSIRHNGRAKPYTVSRERLAVLFEKFPDLSKINNITNEFRNAIGGCNSTAYWSVLNKIKEFESEAKKSNSLAVVTASVDLGYEEKKAIVKRYWKQRDTKRFDLGHAKPFVFIIDEINRGNVSQIFGELISLIEDDKRIGKSEVIYLDLPYSKQSFGVPPNLHIIGTMNTADRSVEALDTALRRRFSFVPMMPEESRLGSTQDGMNLSSILNTLNTRLRILKNNDHTIGHAWFWNVNDIEGLRHVFGNKILPLLQEYFYNDYEKLGLLLGDAFFKKQEQVNSNIFANFSGGSGLAGQYEQSWQFELKTVSELTINDFKTLETLEANN